jgi:hypothetical protein
MSLKRMKGKKSHFVTRPTGRRQLTTQCGGLLSKRYKSQQGLRPLFKHNKRERMKSSNITLVIGGAMFGALYAIMIWLAL